MLPEEIKNLIGKYQARTISMNEREQLFRWYNEQAKSATSLDDADMHIRLERIAGQLPALNTKPVRQISWIKWAAAAIITMAVGLAIYTTQQKNIPLDIVIQADSTKGAELVLATGKVISLNEVGQGDTIDADGSKLFKTSDGYIAYSFDGDVNEASQNYSFRTPVGTETKILLPDGTKVWLNAASELSFQKQWAVENREVYLKGEAYFEVSKQRNPQGLLYTPFKVYSAGQAVEVLGTKFRIQNYQEEAWSTTSLFEGSVKLEILASNNRVDKAVILKPGQQGLYNRDSRLLDFKNISENAPQSWRDGYFSFHGESLREVCAQLARWYPVSFDIDANLPKGEYHGDIPKTYSLNEVLDILIDKDMNYKFSNENNQIKVRLNQEKK